MKLESSIVINRPTETVWAYMSNFEKTSTWNPATVEMRLTSEPPLREGSTYTWVGQFLGRRIESNAEVTVFEPNREFAYKIVSGPFPGTASNRLESVAGSTQVVLTSEADMSGFFKLAEPVLAAITRRQLDGMLANLKDILEAQE